MNPVKLSFLAIVLFALLAAETNSHLHHHRKYFGWGALGLGAVGAAPLVLTPALIPAYLAVAPKSHIPLLLLLKLLVLKKTILVATPAVAIGSLVVGSGAGLLAGKLGTLALLDKLQPYKDSYHYFKHKHYAGGWGFKTNPPRVKGHHRVAGYLISILARQAHRTVSWVKRINHAHQYYKHRLTSHGWKKNHVHVHVGHSHGHGHAHGHGHHGHHAHSHHVPTHYHGHAHNHRHDVPTHYHATQSAGYAHDRGYSEAFNVPSIQYAGVLPTAESAHHGLSFNSGPPYLTSGDAVIEESQVKHRVVKRDAPTKATVPAKTSDMEYFAGVLSHVAEPITDFINGVTSIFGGKPYKPTTNSTKDSTTTPKPVVAESIDPDDEKAWEFPGLSAQESEKYLEQHFKALKSDNPEEAMNLIRLLRQAYSQTLTDLGLHDENKLPDFLPIPMSEEDKESRRWQQTPETPTVETPTEEPAIDYDVSKEVGQFFSLIHSFDNETCFQKLVCDVHTRVNETADNFTPYEENLLAVFRMLGTVLNEGILDHNTAKYLAAAKFGAENESSELCQYRYPECHYSSNEIMDMGIELENENPFSIPGYLVSKLGNTLNERQAQQLLNINPIEETAPSLES